MSDLPLPLTLLLLAVTLTAALTDLRARRIPNWLTAGGTLAGCIAQTALDGWSGLANAGLGMALALAIHIPLFVLRWSAGGDVKLMTAVGAIAGPYQWLSIFILSSIAAGVYAVCLLAFRNVAGGVIWNLWHMLKASILLRMPHKSRMEADVRHPEALTVPRGPAVAIGVVLHLILV